MNGPDSISDPVARRLCCTESYPSARGSATKRLGSARGWWCGRWVPLCWRVCWLVDDVAADMACLLCMLTSHLHQADVIPGMPIVHADITIMSCWRHSYPGQHVGRVIWYSGQVNPSGWRRRVGRVCARGQTPCRRVMESAAMFDVWFWRRFHQWLRLGLLYTVVWSNNHFENFHFWAKIKHHLNHQLWYQLLGIPAPPCADRGCTDSCSTESKAHWHNILRGSAKPPTSTGESILLEIYRERITTYMEEEDHFTPSSYTQLSLSLHSLAHTHVLSLSFFSQI